MKIKCDAVDGYVCCIQLFNDLFVGSTAENLQELGTLFEFLNWNVFNNHIKPGETRDLLDHKTDVVDSIFISGATSR